MKKSKFFIFAVVVTLLALSAPPSLAALNQQITHQVQYSGTPVIGTDTLGGVIYSIVRYGDLYNGGGPGMPSLPIDYLKFSVPYNATNFTVTAAMIGWSNQNLNHMLYPCQRPMLTDGSDTLTITLPDSTAYYSGEFYPSQRAWVVDEGFLAGENHIVTVALMPFRYKHTTTADILSKVSRCIVSLRYELSDSLAMYPIIRRDSLLREEGYELTRSMVVNPNKVKDFAPTQTFAPGIDSIGFIQGFTGDLLNGGFPDPTPVDPGDLGEEELLIDGGNYTYLIVTTSELKHAVRRIAALKRQKGYNVKIVTINEVLSSPLSGSGDVVGEGSNAHLTYTDNAGKLRQYLRNHYKYYGTEYVLLVGDLPYRIISGKDFPLLTDSYFSDLSASWQDTTTTDLNPELYVGRVSANYIGSDHVNQINNYTEKLFRYELNPGNGDYSYLRKALFSQGKGLGSYLYNVKANLDLIYPNPVSIDDRLINNSLHPNGKDIIDTLNSNPVGFVSIFNHGDTTRTRIYGSDTQVDDLFFVHARKSLNIGNGLNCLQNKNYPMIYYSPSCVTVPFDNNKKLTYGESFITGKDYGGPVYMGYTRSSFMIDGKTQAEAFSKRINDGYVKLCVALSMSKLDVELDSLINEYILCYFGDPELELWTDIPSTFSNITVQRTDDSITVSGIDADSTIISYCCKNNMKKQKIVTTPNISISLDDASPNSPIMLYKHNYLPYIAPLLLQNERFNNSKYIIANDVLAGNAIDSNRTTSGDVVIKDGIEYEIEAKGTVTLEDGFIVEKGAVFSVCPACF